MEIKKDYIFVYGVFRDQAKKLLSDSEYLSRSYIKGKLWMVNEFYPGFTRSNDGKVWGDIYLINNELLSFLDEYEGDEYQRIKIITGASIECWVYEYKNDVRHYREIASGDWFLR
jgi:gamma-glutamylcyclotransferase (GGCT)/AIG2-like uncharacterized protein YtfP